jgi:hypothetical protein
MKCSGTQNQHFIQVSKTVQAFQFGVQTDASTLYLQASDCVQDHSQSNVQGIASLCHADVHQLFLG